MSKTFELVTVLSLVLGALGNEFLGGTAFVNGRAYVAFMSASDDFESGRGGYVWWYDVTTEEQGIVKLFSGSHGISDLAVSASGRICGVGSTTDGDNFDATAGAVQTEPRGASDGFVACVNADGSDPARTLLGGDETDFMNAVAFTNNFVIVGGYSASTNLSLSFNAIDTEQSAGEGFVAMLSPTLSIPFYFSLLGGDGYDSINGIHVDEADRVTLVGGTEGLPLANTQLISDDTELADRAAFVAQFDVAGDGLISISSMYLDGPGSQSFTAIDVGDDGSVHASGTSSGADALPEFNGFRILGAAYPLGMYVALAVVSNAYTVAHGTFLGNENGAGGSSGVAAAASDAGVVFASGWTQGDGDPTGAAGFTGTAMDVDAEGSPSLLHAWNINGDMGDANDVSVERSAKLLVTAGQRDIAAASGKSSGAQAQTDIEIQLYRYVVQSGSVARDEFEPSIVSPTAITSLSAYPNPFAESLTISYELARAAAVRFELFDVRGARVFATDARHLGAGSHEETISGARLAPGVYLGVVTGGEDRRATRIVVAN